MINEATDEVKKEKSLNKLYGKTEIYRKEAYIEIHKKLMHETPRTKGRIY